MNSKLVAGGIHYYGRSATGRHDPRFKGERHIMAFQVFDGFLERFQLHHQMRTIAAGLRERFIADSQRIWPDVILDLELVAENRRGRPGKTRMPPCLTKSDRKRVAKPRRSGVGTSRPVRGWPSF
jgi:hypothetical protein